MEPELECQIQKVKEKQWGLRQAAQGNFQVSPLRQCRGLHIRFVILWCLAWGLAATGIIAATDVGIQRFAHSCDTGRSATKCRKRRFAFETTPTQQHQEMPAESGTQGTSAGEARIADADLSRRGQSTYSKRKAEAQGRCRDLAGRVDRGQGCFASSQGGQGRPDERDGRAREHALPRYGGSQGEFCTEKPNSSVGARAQAAPAADVQHATSDGRTDAALCCTYLWNGRHGSYSSNNGRDLRQALQEDIPHLSRM